MSSCRNFTVFSFVMVSNNNKNCTISGVMLLLLSNNINIQSPWMLSLEIFGSVCVAAADYRQIGYRPSILAGAPKDFINEYNNSSKFFTSSRKISCSEKVFIYFIFYIDLKLMGLNLSTNLPMFVYTFQAMWRHRPLKEYSVFVGICVACTFFSPYTLVHHSQVMYG